MKRLFYIRHGETEMNVAHLFSGTINTQLTDKGIKQAIETGKELKARKIQIDLILCSPLDRAFETAKLIAEEIDYPVSNIQKYDLLVERTYGILEGKPSSHYLGENYHELDAIEGSETIQALQERATRAFEYISQLDYDNVLVVAHNAFGRALRRVTKNQPHADEYEKFEQIPNAAILELI